MSNKLIDTHDDWDKWSNYVLTTLKEMKETTKSTDTKVNEIKLEMLSGMQRIITKIAVLETKMSQKAALTGGAVGFVSSIIIGILVFFITRG